MVDLNALNDILSTRNGVWATFMVLSLIAWRGWQHIPAIIAAWAARRQVIAAERDADWNRRSGEIQRLAVRVDTLEQKEEDCQAALREALGRLAQVEGFMMGQGKARQDAANIVAVERLTDKVKGPK
jgi:hypothetical protein